MEVFKVYGKVEVKEFNVDSGTAKLFYPHHKSSKKAKDRADGMDLDGQKLSVDWMVQFKKNENDSGDEKK